MLVFLNFCPLCRTFMEVTRPEETTVKPKEKQMSATQMAHEIMSAGKNCGCHVLIILQNIAVLLAARL